MTAFMATLDGLIDEERVTKSECGPSILELISSLRECSHHDNTRDLVVKLCESIQSCIDAGSRCKLPSATAGKIWPAFHELRLGKKMHEMWEAHVSTMKVSAVAKKASSITLQIILDRLLKFMIKMKKEDLVPHQQAQPPSVSTLNMIDRNVVHYMAGYTAFQLLKRYKKKSSHPAVQQKRKMFVSILKGMKSDGNNDDSISVWTELIDRGGLFHVNTPTYEVMELIECKVRQYLHSTTMQPNQHHQAAIKPSISFTQYLAL